MRWTLPVIVAIGGCLFFAARLCAPNPSDLRSSDMPDNLGSIPPDNPKLYEHVQVAEEWKNPFLQVHGDLVSIRANGMQTNVSVGKVVAVLGELPVSAWPYGNVVAIEAGSGPQTAETAASTEQTRVQLEVLLKANGIGLNEWP